MANYVRVPVKCSVKLVMLMELLMTFEMYLGRPAAVSKEKKSEIKIHHSTTQSI